MNVRGSYIVVGVVLILSGIKTYITGWNGKYGFPVPEESGLFLAAAGLIFFFFGILHKESKKKHRGFFICDKCKEQFSGNHVSILVCPKCKGKLVKTKLKKAT
jgi:uncharacterized protein YbaR (Trm112 family)